jgi:hypothetical protein
MSFDPSGYVLTAEGADALWFLDTRMTVLAGGDQTRGGFTFLEWGAPRGLGHLGTSTTTRRKPSTSSTVR